MAEINKDVAEFKASEFLITHANINLLTLHALLIGRAASGKKSGPSYQSIQ